MKKCNNVMEYLTDCLNIEAKFRFNPDDVGADGFQGVKLVTQSSITQSRSLEEVQNTS